MSYAMKQICCSTPHKWIFYFKPGLITLKSYSTGPGSYRTKTYQDLVFKYLSEKQLWKRVDKKLNDNDKKWNRQWVNLDTKLLNLPKHCKEKSELLQAFDKELHHVLPTYLFSMKDRIISQQVVKSCDLYCLEVFKHSEQRNFTALQVLQGWLNVFHPQIIKIRHLDCYGKLINARGREVFRLWIKSKDLPNALVHLAAFAGLKKDSIECNEILNKIATFCDLNLEITYKLLSPFELAIISEALFKSGLRLDFPKSLSHISNTLCKLLSEALEGDSISTLQDFNPYVIISLLKILRQVNYIEDRLLLLLGKLMLSSQYENKVRNVRFISNIVSAFVGPLRTDRIFSSNSKQYEEDSSKVSKEKILNRMESFVVGIIQDEETTPVTMAKEGRMASSKTRNSPQEVEVDSGMKSRLKDISRWLWATSALGYQLNSSEIYQKSLSRRIYGEFISKPSDATDALLALAIMNHYPEDIVKKILHSTDFREAISAKCSKRHKGRFGLFLTSLNIERNDIWSQLSTHDQRQWFQTLGTAVTQTPTSTWNKGHIRTKPLKIIGILNDMKPQTQLLNECMDAINAIFCGEREENKDNQRNDNYSNKITIGNGNVAFSSSSLSSRPTPVVTFADPGQMKSDASKIEVFVGYAIPFLHIPGIKMVVPNTGQEVFIEVLNGGEISPSFHQYKLRLMNRLNYTTLSITREEIENQTDLKSFFNFLLVNNLEWQ